MQDDVSSLKPFFCGQVMANDISYVVSSEAKVKMNHTGNHRLAMS